MFKARVFAVVLLAAIAAPGPAAHSQPSPYFFEETFDNPSLDPMRWRIENLTTGPRWCDGDPGAWIGPGQWVDPTTTPCFGATQAAPYGTATLASGLLQLATPPGTRAFPYLVTRLPGSVMPFPDAGDFRVTFRMRYDHRGGWGTGLMILHRDSTDPSGTLAPVNHSDVALDVWADAPIILHSAVSGAYQEITSALANPDAFHEYSLQYQGGAYTVSVDGVPMYGPVVSLLRPNAIWIGNPVLSYWSTVTDWSLISVDYIRVEAFGPTASHGPSWGRLKVLYR
jgi:hypothetical protein